MKHNYQIFLFLLTMSMILSACGGPTSPQAFPSQTQTSISNATLQPNKTSTATLSPIIATLTAIALLPTQTSNPPTSTPGTEINQGGVLIAKGDSQIILYGQRSGSSAQEVHIVDDQTFAEVTTQQTVQLALSGGGPSLFAYFADQKFTNQNGGTALADISLGSTEDPSIAIGFMWSSQIDGKFPASDLLSTYEDLFSVQAGQPVEQEGWLEFGQIWTKNSNLSAVDQQEGFSFFLFHHDDEIYILGFLPDYQTFFPTDDLTTPSGPEHIYLVHGFTGGTIYMPLGGLLSTPVPILQLNDIERQ